MHLIKILFSFIVIDSESLITERPSSNLISVMMCT